MLHMLKKFGFCILLVRPEIYSRRYTFHDRIWRMSKKQQFELCHTLAAIHQLNSIVGQDSVTARANQLLGESTFPAFHAECMAASCSIQVTTADGLPASVALHRYVLLWMRKAVLNFS
eukprot:EC123792.1.p1 GENE.EC123792.1~~EC123792.1.p1  ORF type:complete len:118 (-),score=5.91 EC123792.1:174-527(-)